MKPIPLSILNQSATLKIISSTDNWGAETTTEHTLENVYFEPSNKILKGKDNTEIEANTFMAYDIVNSVTKLSGSAVSPNFNEDDIIIFNSKEYRILTIDTIYQQNKTDIHHYEIYLR